MKLLGFDDAEKRIAALETNMAEVVASLHRIEQLLVKQMVVSASLQGVDIPDADLLR